MSIADILIGCAVLALLIARQVVRRPARTDQRPALLLVLLVLGVVQIGQYLQHHTVDATAWAMLATSLVVAALFGVARAYTMRLWWADGTLWRQGTWLTVVLWLAAIAVHLGADALIDANGTARGLAEATLVLYIAVSFGVQRLVTGSRAARLAAPGPSLSGPTG